VRIKEETTMPNALFTITSEQAVSHYLTENFGALREVLALLHRVKNNVERNPNCRLTAAGWLTHTSKRGLPFSPHPSLRLFESLEPEDFSARLRAFHAKPKADRIVTLDYDANLFALSEWTPDGIETLSGPLDGVAAAYGAALRKKNSTQTYLNEKVFTAEMERVCTVETEASAPRIADQDSGGPKLTM